jgi:hypothetical protein
LARTSNPSPPRLVGDFQTAPSQEIFDVAKAKPETLCWIIEVETGGEQTRSSSTILPGNQISEIVGLTEPRKRAGPLFFPTVLVISRASSGFSPRPGRD